MANSILITGGAGFIGRHVAAALLDLGHQVRIFDNFHEQVHGRAGSAVDGSIPAGAEVVRGDIRDGAAVAAALGGIDQVVHLAAEVGVGQSMYEVERYVAVNELGTAVLMQQLVNRPVERVVTASSMSIYGEGLYRDPDGKLIADARRRSRTGGDGGTWDPVDKAGRRLEPLPTPEWKQPVLSSVYALNKFSQEQMTLVTAAAYGIEAVALRLFNVYGPGQALSNPYTGVLAIFASRLLNNQPPVVFEDGNQRRDFVHVEDVARAFVLALDHPDAAGRTFNIGSGQDSTILDVARRLQRLMQRDELEIQVTGKARAGDIRHCFADIARARDVLGYAPSHGFDEGLQGLVEWVSTQGAEDRVGQATRELEARGLVA